jgi:transcriptional regulator with PAS, ATPase and Fis domain
MLAIDFPPVDWESKIKEIREPYLFLKRENRIFAYVHLSECLSKNEPITMRRLTEQSSCVNPGIQENGPVSLPIIFKLIGEPISLILDSNGNAKGYIKREELLVELFKQENKSIDLLKSILTSIPMGIFVVDNEKRIINYNDTGLRMIKATPEEILHAPSHSIFDPQHIHNVFLTKKTVLNQLLITEKMGVLVDYSPITNQDGQVEGMVIIVQDLPMVEDMAMEIDHIKSLNEDLHAILSSVYDNILVVNQKGELIRFSENGTSDFWGLDLNDLLGKNLIELEAEGIFQPSVTRLVMEQKKKVSIVQETVNGKKILAVGNPIFSEKGDLQRIIIASRDITESVRLKSELRNMKKIKDKYKKELDNFMKQDRATKRLVYCSTQMEKIMSLVKKVANFSSTVLIYGESGVGKEVIAQAIHQLGGRGSQPLLKVNCGAIPENLLESELFGYVKGAFTGADKNGKDGYFRQADKGILFLDEIGELPLHLQVKLLRVLQEQEFVPIGSTLPIKVDVQIIAATNKKLEKLVEQGMFREDLYYRLNVIPIRVPPLRERTEDIPLLAFHFLQELNEKYQRSFHLTPDALSLLEGYMWPGNIRELHNIIERLVVSADEDAIDAKFVNQFLSLGYDFQKTKPMINRIMPLQEAMNHVEEQLILLAMKQYKTTTKAAKALGISQSSVSRKYQKIINGMKLSSFNAHTL